MKGQLWWHEVHIHKNVFFIVSTWTLRCSHLSREICLPLLKTLLLNWQKHWKWNLWSPESSVKELKQSQEGKRLQLLWDHTSLCSPISCPPETGHFWCRDISPCGSPALPAESRGPHSRVLGSVPLTTRRTEGVTRGCCCDALCGGGESAQVWKMQCASETVLIVSVLEGKEKKTRIAIRGCPGRKKIIICNESLTYLK